MRLYCNKCDFTGLLTCIEMAPALFWSGAISSYLSPLWHFAKYFIFVSQRRHGFCRWYCRLQEKNVSLRHSSSQVQRSNIAIAANPTLSLCRFQIKNTKQSYPLQSQCLRIADKCCVRIPQLSGKFACPGLRTKLSPCIFFLLFFSHIILIFI